MRTHPASDVHAHGMKCSMNDAPSRRVQYVDMPLQINTIRRRKEKGAMARVPFSALRRRSTRQNTVGGHFAKTPSQKKRIKTTFHTLMRMAFGGGVPVFQKGNPLFPEGVAVFKRRHPFALFPEGVRAAAAENTTILFQEGDAAPEFFF